MLDMKRFSQTLNILVHYNLSLFMTEAVATKN